MGEGGLSTYVGSEINIDSLVYWLSLNSGDVVPVSLYCIDRLVRVHKLTIEYGCVVSLHGYRPGIGRGISLGILCYLAEC